MTVIRPETIKLTEYQPTLLAHGAIPSGVGEILWRDYSPQIAVEFPSPKTEGQWRLTPQGWVGHIPVTSEFHFAFQPKVALGNLFRMLEYAYDLESFRFLDGLIDCQSLEEFYERLANILAKRVLDRGRKGFYRAYVPETAQLPYVRGRLDVQQAIQSPQQIKLQCHYQQHTADVEENQILAWTLLVIARSGICREERALPTVRRAYQALQRLVTVQPHSPTVCVNRLYTRLNDDYRPMHSLCRFFLEQSGPGHRLGDHTMLPFLVDMARLYERFVAKWLKAHLPPELHLETQERVNIGETGSLYFDIDLVLSEVDTGLTRCVLDTKYKDSGKSAPDDIHQMISYAHTKGCSEAILVYPTPLKQPFDETIRGIRVRSLTFSLDDDLEQAGRAFLQSLNIK